MYCRDREAFAQAFLVFAQASQLAIPPGSAEFYWIVLQQYPWELVERGLQRVMRRRWSTFPPPSALAELIEEVIAHDLVEDGDVALAFVKGLLTAMQRESREVKAEALGVLGEAHVATYLSTHYQVEAMSLKYRKLVDVTERLPLVLEVACGWYSRETTAKAGRRNLIGINWTPALKPPFVELPALAVRSYIGHWHEEVPTDVRSTELDHDCPTRGSANRYRFAVFLEKEGFYLLLEAAQIAERYDIAIMITKGMSVTAARKLVDEMSQHGVTVLVCHDFDKSGFSILHTLRTDTRRSTFHPRPTVVDLGSGWWMCKPWICRVSPRPIRAVSTPVSTCASVAPRRRNATSWCSGTTMTHWRCRADCRRCTVGAGMRRLGASWPMGQACPISTTAPPPMRIGSSKPPSRPTCPSSSPPSLSSSSTSRPPRRSA